MKIIAKSNKKNRNRFIREERDFYTAYEAASDQGLTINCLNKLKNFRGFICDLDTEKHLLELDHNLRGKCHFELKKIYQKTDHILKKYDDS